MTREEVKQKAHEYIDTQLKENPEWLDCITDSWIYDAEDWFFTKLREMGAEVYVDDVDYEFTEEGKRYHDMFWEEFFVYKKEKEIEINGVRDGLLYLKDCLYDIKRLEAKIEKANELLMPHFVGDCSLENPPKVGKAYFTILLHDTEQVTRDINLLKRQINEAIEKYE